MARGHGYVINLVGGGATSPRLWGSGCGCSKAGLLASTEPLALEAADTGVKVSGAVLTEALEGARDELLRLRVRQVNPLTCAFLENMLPRTPHRRSNRSTEECVWANTWVLESRLP